MKKPKLGDLVEYWVPIGDEGRLDHMGMLGLVVGVGGFAPGSLIQVLWAQFEEYGPQWEKIKHLRAPRRKRPGSLEDRGEVVNDGGR